MLGGNWFCYFRAILIDEQYSSNENGKIEIKILLKVV